MKPFNEILDNAVDLPIEDVTAQLVDELAAADPLDATAMLQVTMQFCEDAARFAIGISLDTAETLGALPDGRAQADYHSDRALEYIRAAALYRAVEDGG